MTSRSGDALLCVLCEQTITDASTARCLTDCAHEFCLACLCRVLSVRKNACPICEQRVKTVQQVQGLSSTTAALAPVSIRFCNVVYVLYVSIWSVQDPARVLAGLFALDQARLVHKGKLLKKGDVWPGTIVQLFGTRKKEQAGVAMRWWQPRYWQGLVPRLDGMWLARLQQVLCCPCSVLYAFVRSLFVQDEHVRRQYQLVDNPNAAAPGSAAARPTSFHEPGRVSAPHFPSEDA